ncbi:hypothetical protein Ahy_A01g000428 [Arachis hypogaea]|uniref:Protein kinase domain-containing protein n=1 Tax=Arachis hypogaea TaxID=3818 RepID=A0A445EKH9_ARAHY|nr:hypothetical protein Ahy_A01g000428 [Arachis hypogaea]
MEDKKVNTIAIVSVVTLIIVIMVARIALKLSKAFFLICGADVAVIVAIFSFVLIRNRYNKRRKQLESRFKSEGRELRIEYSFLRKVAGVPTKFRYTELEEATDGFQALLGKGSSATVFKGILSDGTSVAVKRIDDGAERGEREFRSEVAAIASVQHVNLVRLYGYCNAPSSPRYLVYEYISNVREGKLMEIVDERLLVEGGGGVEESEVVRLVNVALWCIQERPRMRPSMAQVADMLEGRVTVEEPPDSRMVLVDLISEDEDNPAVLDHNQNNMARLLTSMSSHEDCSSTYSMGTTTILSGR